MGVSGTISVDKNSKFPTFFAFHASLRSASARKLLYSPLKAACTYKQKPLFYPYKGVYWGRSARLPPADRCVGVRKMVATPKEEWRFGGIPTGQLYIFIL